MAGANVQIANRKYSIKTVNSFPTGAGLASSASGYCALVLALAKIHGLAIDSDEDRRRLSTIARLGSGSACRSLFGGWVKWTTTDLASYAHQLYPETVWPALKLLVLIVDERAKKTASTQAMLASANTSGFLAYRTASLVDTALAEIQCAIRAGDFPSFARLVIRDSNRLHAICLDTYPPVFYMNDCSFRIVDFVCDFNRTAGPNCEKVAYTFDAGPNAFLFVEEENFDSVLADILKIFPKPSHLEWNQYLLGVDNDNDPSCIEKYLQLKATSSLANQCAAAAASAADPKLKMIIATEIGSGPYFQNV